MTDPRLRASDADRERVVSMLRQQVGEGRLTLDEFSERAASAYQACTLGDLHTLTGDLPAPAGQLASRPHRALVPVLVVLAVLLAGTLLALASPATADAMNHMMAQVGRMCG